jgi:hypothetical protein
MILTYKLTNFFFFSLYPLVGTPWIFHVFLAWGSFFFLFFSRQIAFSALYTVNLFLS